MQYIPLAISNISAKKALKVEKKIIWAARPDPDKRPEWIKYFEEFPIDVYGEKEQLPRNLKQENIKGYIKHKELINKMGKARVFLLTSKIEGFSFAVVEALSRGMAVIIFDTFENAEFFNQCSSVHLFKDAEILKAKIIVKELLTIADADFSSISEQSTSFAKNNLSIDIFISKWARIFKYISGNIAKLQ